MNIRFKEIGICGLSCYLCPRYQTDTKSRCLGCKSEDRLTAGCPFITCAIKKKVLSFVGTVTSTKHAINGEKAGNSV